MISLRCLRGTLFRPSIPFCFPLRVSCPSLRASETARSTRIYSKGPREKSILLDLEELEQEPIANPHPALPITAISGFSGAGKTSLVKHVLESRGEQRIGVLVDDLSRVVSVDPQTIKGYLSNPQEDVLQMSGGCIFCAIGDDLGDRVDELAEKREFDYLLVEGSGVEVPMHMAENLFDSSPEDGGLVRLDTMVTVVDSAVFLKDVVSGVSLEDRNMSEDGNDDRTVGEILVEQVEFANIIILNKIDLVRDADKERLRLVLEELNPGAKIIEAVSCQISPSEIMNTGMFDPVAAMGSPGWLQKINESSTTTEAQEKDEIQEVNDKHSGISSFVYRAKYPFHPGRLLENALSQTWQGVIRSKGFFWLATRNDRMGLWQSAGPSWGCDPGSPWLASLADNELPDGIDKTAWDKKWGDRSTEIVWTGEDMDPTSIKAMLDDCLLTSEEMKAGPAKWSQIPDELPPWPVHEWMWQP